ncbi:serine/threonine-protein kinase [Microcoleus sp. PH2017_28_MFU_U_A]|uniref:serine/threonine-protein kinase n=1 Tax=Microcoleus sp. PH2017_28_MFU_U_A TaxID=2798838 RepID=UPI001D28EF9E|nr:serine/threonine-protein kinase [Microcoleus sp. PH2017_28_MFU_U_A]MCC3593546.1 GUN4 domain-containing protein [Microcoleus sp. PH2017_28_MFU_U_A]
MRRWPDGQQLDDGKYIIEEYLGGGGFGETYRAQNRHEGRSVAIKTLNLFQQFQPDFAKTQNKFLKEAMSLAKCRHPHIVEVYDIFREGDFNCMVMELIDGIDLATHLKENGRLSEQKALSMIQQLGDALTCVHKQNLTHRDVKPENIMLRKRGIEAVLIDFGLARQATLSGKLMTNSSRGTEHYAPIELAEQRPQLGAYTDVYSLAATLYNMLTDNKPIPSPGRKIIDPFIQPKQYDNKISDRVNAAIIKGMEFEPQNRPQSVQEWLDLLIPKPVVLPSPKVSPQPAQKSFEMPPKPVAAETTRVISAVGMDYINLRNLLAAKKWKEADEETARVMLKVAGRDKEGWLDAESIQKFPCEDLRTIDQLWVEYSNGRFGFSAQKRIYQSLGGTSQYDSEIWEKFGDKVGWRKNNEWPHYYELTFSETAVQAHLPVLCLYGTYRWRSFGVSVGGNEKFSSLASRIVDCNI